MPDLKAKLAAIEAKLAASLEEVRAELNHKGNKGSKIEQELRIFLKEHLPRTYSCGQGEIIDLSGATSKQTDIIITNEYHPFIYQENTPGLYLIEGVSAVGEVKSILDKSALETTIASATVLRGLKNDPGQGTTRRISAGDAKFFDSPPFFLFAFETALSLETIDECLKENLTKHGRTIDAVFILKKGHAVDFGDGKGALTVPRSDGTNVTGWLTRKDENVLLHFLGWLHACMPLTQRVIPILPPYLFSES
jgi:hypothetical protein